MSLIVALNKGRILSEVLPLLAAAGVEPTEDPRESRRLIFPTSHPEVRLIVVRSGDVPTCVEHGAAAIGVTGKDTLLEHGGGGVYEPLDLGIARCRLMTAAPIEALPRLGPRLRVATKFINVARRFYSARGQQVDLIQLGGAMELAPLIGLADQIVDIVDTGRTLAANGLEPKETIAHISSRVVVNKAAMKRQAGLILPLLDALERAVAARQQLETTP
ncbi:MAG: ATP phosphoribosyltransferase [Gammaproteobacteria bacterium]|nr:MAG: ATP phosphoribosyltransferase [Gammaproteobacteria bacterium]